MKAFVSYSHHDAQFLTDLHQHLAALRRQKLLDTWTDRKIDAGAVIDEEIAAAMTKADLFILLVSSSFINSDYCYDKEFKKALEKQKAGKALIVPIIIRPCDWQIPEISQFKVLPDDGHAINSNHWHSPDEGFANVVKGLRSLIENRKKGEKFSPDESHVTVEQREELRGVHDEIVKRLIAKKSGQPDDIVKAEYGKWAGIVWSQFNEKFETKAHGLQSLDRSRFAEAKTWLQQYRASNDKNFKRVNPHAYRATLTKTIYSLLKPLGWTKEQLYDFAAEKLERPQEISSLNDLGNSQLELVRDRVRYEVTKSKKKFARAKTKQATKLKEPVSPFAKELLQLILEHPNEDEKGLTEILVDSPFGPLNREFIPNTTASGSAPSVKKRLFTSAVAELVQLGWLLQPEEDHAVRIYELNPQAIKAA